MVWSASEVYKYLQSALFQHSVHSSSRFEAELLFHMGYGTKQDNI